LEDILAQEFELVKCTKQLIIFRKLNVNN